MSDDLLSRLRAAGSEEERDWLLTQTLLAGLSADLKEAAWAAAVPHWFDDGILAALLERPTAECAAVYAELQTLPIVEPFQARGGHNVHEVTRAAMLDHLWRERRDEYATYSARAADCFAGREEPAWQIEHVYHLLVADPELGADRLWNLSAEWNNSFQYSAQNALAQAAAEQAKANRTQGRAHGWAYYCLGDMERRYYRHEEAKRALLPALESVDGDRQLEANCIQALGDVHMRLAEYGEARARYEEARPIYHAIGDRLGEANCDLGLADVARDEEDWAQAERLYHAALGVYREIAMPFNVALALRRLGAVAEGKGERAEAIRSYQEALDIFAAIGVPLAEHTRADLERLQGSE
jgi:hypothetical protein